MTYVKHFKINIIVSLKSLYCAAWHLAHAIIPIRYTSHEYWGINFGKNGD